MKEADIQEKIQAGHLRARAIFEVIGNPKEHVAATLREYLANIKKEERIILLKEDHAEPEQMEDGQLWSTFCEAEFLASDLEVLTWLCTNFTPASIEIIEPEEFLVTQKDLGIWLNELLLRLHEIGIGYKQQNSENHLLKRNINALIRNSVMLALTKSMSKEQVCKAIGITDATIVQPFFDALEKEGKLVQEGELLHAKKG